MIDPGTLNDITQKIAEYILALPDGYHLVKYQQINHDCGLSLTNEEFRAIQWDNFILLSTPQKHIYWISPGRENDEIDIRINCQVDVSRFLANKDNLFFDRWGLSDQRFDLDEFKIRLANECTEVVNEFSKIEEYSNFYCLVICKVKPTFPYNAELYVSDDIKLAKTVDRIARILQTIFSILSAHKDFSRMVDLKLGITKVLDLTSNPPFYLDTDILQGEINLFKSGAALLDENLVETSLNWLGKYPEAKRLFMHALSNYNNFNQTDEEARTIYDGLRASLEKLICNILGNEKTLRNNKGPIEEWLKAKGAHQNVIGAFKHILHV